MKVSVPIGTASVAVHATGAVVVQPGSPASRPIDCDAIGVEPCAMAIVIDATLAGRYWGNRRAAEEALFGIVMRTATDAISDDALPGTAVRAPPPPPQPAASSNASAAGAKDETH